MSEADLLAATREFLDRVEVLGGSDPDEAMQLLRRRVRLYLMVLGRGAPLHQRLREVVLSLSPAEPARVELLAIERLGDFGSLVDEARAVDAVGVAVLASDQSAESDVVAELEAELTLAEEPGVVLALLIGDPWFFVRRTFLLGAATEEVPPDMEMRCVGAALEEVAIRAGLEVRRL